MPSSDRPEYLAELRASSAAARAADRERYRADLCEHCGGVKHPNLLFPKVTAADTADFVPHNIRFKPLPGALPIRERNVRGASSIYMT